MVRNERGNTLIIVLVTITVLLLAVVLLMPALSQRESNQERTYRNLQVTEMANSTMQSLLEDPSILLKEKNPLIIKTPDSDAMDVYAEAIDSEGHPLESKDLTRVPFTLRASAYYGDLNHNRSKDIDEKFFTKKIITSAASKAVLDIPNIPNLTFVSYISSKLILNASPNSKDIEANMTIVPHIYKAVINKNGEFETSILSPQPLISPFSNSNVAGFKLEFQNAKNGSFYCVKAANAMDESLESGCAIFKVSDGLSAGNGLVKKEEGNVTIYEAISPQIYTPGILTVLKGNHVYNQNGGDIDFSGDLGVIIENEVFLNLLKGGQGDIKLTSNSGSITLQEGSGLNSFTNSNDNKSTILLKASTGIYIDKTQIYSERGISLETGQIISAQEAKLETGKNKASVKFILTSSGYQLNIDGLSLDSGEDAAASPKNELKICGNLLSGTINSISNYFCSQ
ncbi:hypothetical protein [Falsibacillus pallidus]|uniref:Uncharacterized protein n=1 Tax=Falsibacillus pallidus TaxID=493781 RepID=A0A370GKG6_9BACI|nr:hypothetical protein [Falsibacillus pallidus]RDI44161.1 hypothetical protein DFR59_103227 [Falsibacillus pallidus]